ncbi:MAG: glycoside hydrolase family 3 N-terminal domain-containing protein [Eubacteriales bacterium]|nr:glycoside hydrolase family 3 N-terminal domain-containing protein [Eubacteriales bacterium]
MKLIAWAMMLCSCLSIFSFGEMSGEKVQLNQASVYQGLPLAYSETLVEQEMEQIQKEKQEKENKQNARIQKYIEQMTLEEKISQLMILTNPKDITVANIQEFQPGGVILFSVDFNGKTVEQVRGKVDQLQEVSNYPMLVCVDEEGGSVSRISGLVNAGIPAFYGARQLGNEKNWKLVKEQTLQKVALLRELGINVNFDPVADVTTSESSYMYSRSAAGDVKTVSKYVKTVVSVMKKENCISCVKHFPGYGENGNTHEVYIKDTRERMQYEDIDFKPFQTGIKAGADMVMVSHIVMQSVDDKNPASLSKSVHDILRKDLAFDSVIISDDLNMRAVLDKMTLAKASEKALEAGNDMIFSADFQASMRGIKKGIRKGRITEEQIDQAVYRVLKMKMEHELLK